MADTQIAFTEEGRALVTEVTGDKQSRSWDIAPDQVTAHLRGVERADHPWSKVAPGDRSALADFAADKLRAAALDERNR